MIGLAADIQYEVMNSLLHPKPYVADQVRIPFGLRSERKLKNHLSVKNAHNKKNLL